MDKQYGKVKIKIPGREKKDCTQKAKEYAPYLREADIRELEAMDFDREYALYMSLFHSSEVYEARGEHDEPLMIFGYEERNHFIWALGTIYLEKYNKELIQCGKEYIRECIENHGHVENWIHENNTKALRYIKHAGAKFTETCTTNTGDVFIKFEIGGQLCAQ